MPATETQIPQINLDLIQTLAIAGLIFLTGMLLKKKISVFERLNIPSAVLGGLVFAAFNLIAHDRFLNIQVNTSMQSLCMMLFFTSIGTNASFGLLKKGGKQVMVFLVLSSAFCVIQNLVGIGVASLFGMPKLFGVMAGSVTLVGGPATGLAFAPLFEEMGLTGAETIAITSATFGIVFGGLLGGPAATFLINRFNLEKDAKKNHTKRKTLASEKDELLGVDITHENSGFTISLVNIGIIMGLGSAVSFFIAKTGITLPAYIGAMIVGAVFRNINDKKEWTAMDQKTIDFAGGIALNIFLTVALMDLRLWELFHLALPLSGILIAQVIVVILFALTITFVLMGKNYESAVMSSGFIGFMLGTVANAMAVMKTIVDKHGVAPKAFLVVPLVGAFFIDYINALVITVFANFLK
ncbi:sodium/glutamate symporter [Lacibacter sp. H375]|uniref:sodium/glutamate symporter n=1 Tax=Lacibacter sp. H375 TaxID=3133424 RepID=UPI0030C2DB3E